MTDNEKAATFIGWKPDNRCDAKYELRWDQSVWCATCGQQRRAACGPQSQYTFGDRTQVTGRCGFLEAQQKWDRRCIHQQLHVLLAHGARRKRLADECELACIAQTERGHELLRIGFYYGEWCMACQQGGRVHLQNNRRALHHDTAALDGFDKVLGALGHETEAGLMCMQFQDATEGLLGDDRKVVGIVQ